MIVVPRRRGQRYKTLPMATAVDRIGALLLCATLSGCGLAPPLRTWNAIGDLQTGHSKSAAEGGQAPRVEPPPALGWSARLEAVDDPVAGPAYHMILEFTDRTPAAGRWRFDPVASPAELVDDQGGRFACTQVLVPDPPAADRREALAHGTWILVFPVGSGYRFAAMTGVSVHWQLRSDGDLAITTRFRS